MNASFQEAREPCAGRFGHIQRHAPHNHVVIAPGGDIGGVVVCEPDVGFGRASVLLHTTDPKALQQLDIVNAAVKGARP